MVWVYEQIKLLALDELWSRSFHLSVCKVRQDISYAENRVVLVLADIYCNAFAVSLYDNAMK